MITSDYAEISDVIRQAFEEMHGRATVTQIVYKVQARLSGDLADYLLRAGVTRQVGQFFRQRNGKGLPLAPAVNDGGTHVQQEFLTLDDLKYLVRRHIRAGEAAHAMASAYADEAKARYGVVIDMVSAEAG